MTTCTRLDSDSVWNVRQSNVARDAFPAMGIPSKPTRCATSVDWEQVATCGDTASQVD